MTDRKDLVPVEFMGRTVYVKEDEKKLFGEDDDGCSMVGKEWVSTVSTPVNRIIGSGRYRIVDISNGDVMRYTTHDGSMSIHDITGVVFQSNVVQDLMDKSKVKK